MYNAVRRLAMRGAHTVALRRRTPTALPRMPKNGKAGARRGVLSTVDSADRQMSCTAEVDAATVNCGNPDA
jgi:hypothetical protein